MSHSQEPVLREMSEQLTPPLPSRHFMHVGLELDDRSHELNLSRAPSNGMVEEFWSNEINFGNYVIEIDRAPFSVFEQTPLAKIHFLFTMLNLSQLIVLNKGFAVGIITKSEFLKNKSLLGEKKEQPPIRSQ